MKEEISQQVQKASLMIKPIRKIVQDQNMFVDLNGFQDDMDEITIEQEWGRSTGSTILPESICKYDITERIDKANKELLSKQSSQEDTKDINYNSSSRYSHDRSLKKLVHFSDTIHTAHYFPPVEEDIDHDDEITAGYWSADDISSTPDDLFISEECESVMTFCDQQEVISCSSPGSGEFWNDSDDESSVDLSALTDSVDRLDLSPLITDSPEDITRLFSPLKSPYISAKKNEFNPAESIKKVKKTRVWSMNSITNKKIDESRLKKEGKTKQSEFKLNKWIIADNLDVWNEDHDKISCWNRLRTDHKGYKARWTDSQQTKTKEESKIQRRACLTKQDQSKLPKYNGLRSEYGLSQQQLNERKRKKAEKRKLRRERRIYRQHEEEERKKANELVYNKWLDKKRQENESKNGKWTQKNTSTPYERVSSAQTRRSQQVDGSKMGLLRRIMSASVHSPKERLTYSIYLGLPIQRDAFRVSDKKSNV